MADEPMLVPAICDSCGAVFPSGIALGSGATNITFRDVGVGPCPRCGGRCHIPDGLYGAIGGALGTLQAHLSPPVLLRLQEILERARVQQTTAAAVKREIEQSVPELTSLGDLLPHSRSELYAFIGILLAALGLILNLLRTESAPKIDLHQVINNYYASAPASPSKTVRPVVGRNAPCPCGSGKKYKKCHGASAPPRTP